MVTGDRARHAGRGAGATARPRGEECPTPAGQCEAWARIGLRYPFNEYRACWKMGGQPLVIGLDPPRLLAHVTDGATGFTRSTMGNICR